jgi:predicted Ser/Thr protein kinase
MASVLPPSLGRYEVLEELGKGAMGVVYLARDPLIGRLVALKTFRAAQAMHGTELVEYRTRFMREAQSAGILSHRNIVTIHDVVDSSDVGLTFIAMEYVRGHNLKELLLRGEPMPLEQVVHVAAQVAEALDYAHSKGVIHRDIKPANIIIDPHGQVKITDFGIARLETSDLTHEGQLLGTPNYMAPERILGHKVDHRTDIFSLGVVIYELLTRQKPFQGENLTMVSHRIVYEPFVPPRHYAPGLPAGVVAVLERALEKKPENRFASAGILARELAAAVATATGSETRVGPRPVLPAGPPPATSAGAAAPGAPDQLPAPAWSATGAGEDSAAATQDVTPVAMAMRRPPRRRTLPGLGRIASLSAGAAVLGLLAAAAAFGWLTLREPPPLVADPGHLARVQSWPHAQRARAELEAGRPDSALIALAHALAVAPDEPSLQRLQDRVRQALAERQTASEQLAQREELLRGATAALTGGDPARAAELSRQVLALVPGERSATAVLREAEGELDRRRREEAARLARAAAPQPGAGQAARGAPAAAGGPVGAPAGQVSLRIDFFTELSEGVLTVYAGQRRLLAEPFAFYKKTGLFRSEPKAGRIEASRLVDAGPTTLRVYVAPPRRSPLVQTLETDLRPGRAALLRIHVDRQRKLTAVVE